MEKLAVLRYARAIFDLAVEKRLAEEYHEAAKGILSAIEQSAEFMTLMSNPSVSGEGKLATVTAAFSGRVPDDFIGLMALTLKRGREGELAEILRHFSVLYREHFRIAEATLYAPQMLPEEKIHEIKAIISRKLDKTINLQTIVDPALIAGFRVEVDGHVFDTSIKTRAKMLKNKLLANT